MYSLAGYCVVTYLLGIGDRHLENVMITNLGKFLHIDFGFAMGEDPNIKPPPFKLTSDMIQGFGGLKSENFKTFTSKCIAYYLKLREHSNLILNLLYMMIDCDLVVNPNKGIKLGQVHIDEVVNKLQLGASDMQAERWFKAVLENSFKSFKAWRGGLQDTFHKAAV
jgi:phosphatidylinositol 3-kinase